MSASEKEPCAKMQLGLCPLVDAEAPTEEKVRWLARFPNQNPFPVLRVTSEGVLVYANPASQPLLGLWDIQVGQTLPRIWYKEVLGAFKANAHRELEIQVGAKTFSLTLAPVQEEGFVNIYGLDITQRKQVEINIKHYLELENLINTVSTSFINLAASDIDNGIELTLETVSRKIGAERGYIFLFNEDFTQMQNPYQCCASDLDLLPGASISTTNYPWWAEKLQTGEPIAIYDVHEMPEAAARERTFLLERATQSILIVPIMLSGRILGFLGFETVQARRHWNTDTVKSMQVVGDIFANALERKRAEEQIQLTNTALDAAANAIMITDHTGHITWANPALTRQTGYTLEEVLGRTPKMFKSGQHGELFYKDLWNTILEGDVWSGEVVNRRKDGSFYVEEQTITPVRDGLGKIRYFVSIRQDVTERKQAEEALRESEETTRMLLEAAPEGIIIVNEESHIVMVNASAEKMFGYQREELLGRPISALLPGPKREIHTQYCQGYLADPHTRPMGLGLELVARCKDGHLLPVEISLGYVKTRQGLLAMSFILDITERKRAEEKQTQLLKELESANQELKDFAYVVSHDLKAPLRGISSLAEWLAQDYGDILDEDGEELIELLLSRVKRMHNLIEGVLQYSRVGRIREDFVAVDLNQLVEDVVDMIVPSSHIKVMIENQLPILECEPTRVAQVFQNLLSNAVKYMDKPEGEIKIGCVAENGFWKFSVADNGPGIEERYFEKIFQLFQTLQARDEFESTGVGLAVVKKTIELYGGRVWVASTVGQGSTFFFTLPQKISKEVPE